MPRYVIERNVPGIGSSNHEELCGAASESNKVLAEMKAERKNIQWEHSYATDDKTFCVYLAENEELIHEHAKRSGFPVERIFEVKTIIDPVTGEG
ncbi:DUF4242 domain-containing protein [Thiomicrorhabdus sediminis]|uniref:DUF4242 domain-containing protein n=1 Tax=Thiomicrorhabdus sediminis TaxID=2580412 RepID=A0A4P9K5M9_9GAMM|nr:DUF4242 domain-containing protein [Thiomicrorhabdus sediminis]QCU90305.1 DUF4242 domain-containing protein [Thiomicrorhabdus sediminis]